MSEALLMAAAATCLLLLSSCSPAEKPTDDDRAMVAESIENLEMQADKLASGTGASCPQEFSVLETGRTLRISMFYGYDNHEGKVHDRVNARSMSHVLTRKCRGKLSACGFSIFSSSKPAVRLMRTLEGRRVEINLFTSSLSRSVKGRFYRELVESDIVFYMGHSRLGGGMEFNPQTGVATLFNAVFRFPMLPVLKALRQRPTKLKMIGMFSCDSNKYFRHDFHGANPSLSLILTTADIYARPAEQASLGALDAVLSKKCARAFHESMMSVNEPNPRMTYLIHGQ
jgi:hypothetical protein